jgi:hypothetical protein
MVGGDGEKLAAAMLFPRLRLRLSNYRRPHWAALEPFASRHD